MVGSLLEPFFTESPSMSLILPNVILISRSNATITFNQLPVNATLSDYYYYKPQYGKIGSSIAVEMDSIQHDGELEEVEVTLMGLEYNTEYAFRVVPIRQFESVQEDGIASLTVAFTTGIINYIYIL